MPVNRNVSVLNATVIIVVTLQIIQYLHYRMVTWINSISSLSGHVSLFYPSGEIYLLCMFEFLYV